MKFSTPERSTSFYESFSDLIFATMAIFVLVIIVLIIQIKPVKVSLEEFEKLKVSEKEKSEQVEALKKQLKDKEKENKEQANKIQMNKKSFLLVLISWSTKNDDIDLHLIDPNGNEFYYKYKRYADSEAALEEDTQRGPGSEIWLHPKATPGQYKVYLKYYKKNNPFAKVRGAIVHQGGRSQINTTLTRQGEKPLIATIILDNEGNVSVQQ